MEKALIVASLAYMIEQFNVPVIDMLIDMGVEVHVACNFERGNICSEEKIFRLRDYLIRCGAKCHQIDFDRSPFNLKKNLLAARQLGCVLKENEYRFIHCHTPVGGVVTRIVARLSRTCKAKVLYTAHGFHFYKNASVKNWLLFYPVELLCSYFTDVLITINQEDFSFAKKALRPRENIYVPGIGVNLARFKTEKSDRFTKREEFGIPQNATVLLSVGELNKNKNHSTVIAAIKDLDVYYLIAGQGVMREKLEQQITSLSLENRVILLGFQSEIQKIYACADIFVFPSYREGLSAALMEAMANGLPCAVSRIRGNTDLIEAGVGGEFFDPANAGQIKEALHKLMQCDWDSFGRANQEKMQQFSLETVLTQMREIYLNILR